MDYFLFSAKNDQYLQKEKDHCETNQFKDTFF